MALVVMGLMARVNVVKRNAAKRRVKRKSTRSLGIFINEMLYIPGRLSVSCRTDSTAARFALKRHYLALGFFADTIGECPDPPDPAPKLVCTAMSSVLLFFELYAMYLVRGYSFVQIAASKLRRSRFTAMEAHGKPTSDIRRLA